MDHRAQDPSLAVWKISINSQFGEAILPSCHWPFVFRNLSWGHVPSLAALCPRNFLRTSNQAPELTCICTATGMGRRSLDRFKSGSKFPLTTCGLHSTCGEPTWCTLPHNFTDTYVPCVKCYILESEKISTCKTQYVQMRQCMKVISILWVAVAGRSQISSNLEI